jgi:hypothetical protein
MARIGSLTNAGETHWRKRWAKGTPCCYIALQTSDGGLIQMETHLSTVELQQILEILKLREAEKTKTR